MPICKGRSITGALQVYARVTACDSAVAADGVGAQVEMLRQKLAAAEGRIMELREQQLMQKPAPATDNVWQKRMLYQPDDI